MNRREPADIAAEGAVAPEPCSSVAAETLAALLTGGETTAFILDDWERTLRADMLADVVHNLAGSLRTLGIEHGDRVALALPEGPVLVESLLAVAATGAAAAPLNPGYTSTEFRFYLEDLRARFLIVPPGELAAAREAARSLSVDVVEVEGDGVRVWPIVEGRRINSQASYDGAGPDDVALLLHTSGTTSRPKQVPLLHRNIMASVRAIARHYALGPDDVSFCAMPLFHVHGMIAGTWAPLASGGAVMLPARLSARAFWRALERSDLTWFSASPTAHQMLLDHAPVGERRTRTTLRFVRSCSAALRLPLYQRLEDRFGVPVLEAYGMTEASHQIASNPLGPEGSVPGSVGLPTGTEVKVVDPQGRARAAEETGEVLIRGPGVTPGYLNNAEANAEAFVDGWFRTGDLGHMDQAGYIALSGRIKELIIRGGENISPHEIEETLVAHPSVKDAVCFGVPDDKYGEAVAAAVVVTEAVIGRELRAFCRSRLAAFKVPTTIHILETLPRTPTGKVQRRRMSELLAREAGD